uniref:Uncharacterized protein n=1 Tax=Pipistrellus kuhlii TaxID=59472 RepID=A0A7J8A8N9_PIPKU|nr:hypothetical protein mPipKuh1_008975 [Pipistrellus kuhlii]
MKSKFLSRTPQALCNMTQTTLLPFFPPTSLALSHHSSPNTFHTSFMCPCFPDPMSPHLTHLSLLASIFLILQGPALVIFLCETFSELSSQNYSFRQNQFGSMDRASAWGLKGPGIDSGQEHVPWLRAHPQ